MGLGYKRADLRANAERKLADAKTLLGVKSPSNSYYLAGYAIELGIKACIAAQVAADTVPSKELLKGFLEHDFRKLIGLAGLATALKEKQDADSDFGANWAIISEWSPDVRYENTDMMSAQVFIQAVDDSTTGVLTWIKNYW